EPEENDRDELLPQAVDVIFESGQASVSMLQRRLKLGYARAARIVDQMEQMGIVGQFEGAKPRALLITRDQWRQMQYLSGNAPPDKAFPDNALSYTDDDDDEDLVTAALEGVQVVLISSDLVEPPAGSAQFAAYQGNGLAPVLAQTGISGAWAAQNVAAQPAIITRAQWGAQTPHWKNGSSCTMNSETALKGAVIHHTAGGNSYATQAAAMQQIRNDQAYHISLNWCDLGYNFVVDKWGNIYEGRAGSINSPVIGAHAAGFNTGTVGISMLGNYDIVDTPAVMVDAVGQIAGWMLGRFGGVDPQSTISYYSASGSTKWKAGSTVRLPAISGHRDVGNTACPGSRGYPQMARIRAVAASSLPVNQLPRGHVDSVESPTPGAIRVSGWAFDPDSIDPISVHIYLNGIFHAAVSAVKERTDVGTLFGRSAAAGFDHHITVPGGTHEVCVFAINQPAGPNPNIGCRTISVAAPENRLPKGSVDIVGPATAGGIYVAGWAFDPDTEQPIGVHIYLNGTFAGATLANIERTDVAARHRVNPNHGYEVVLPATAGTHAVCVYAINFPVDHLANPNLGCRSVTVGS
ncbi:MAG: N-acetylmuramoyl-L-alanine amidase, partial [Promicromonosporaceae bacterium]|nr:N-acetylmuramoyl-L-alanine amidase [Promicromonosporaceae bacterium]